MVHLPEGRPFTTSNPHDTQPNLVNGKHFILLKFLTMIYFNVLFSLLSSEDYYARWMVI